MYRKVNYDEFIENRDGSILVELVFVIFIITLLMKLLISVSEYQSNVGKLDRISYSISGIIRERDRLYENINELTQDNVNQLKILADNMLLASGINISNFTMTVETLHFNPVSSLAPEERVIDDTKSRSFSFGDCQPVRTLREMADLSPYSNRGRWIPLYQVTLCLPAPAWYQSLFSSGAIVPPITSSAITIER